MVLSSDYFIADRLVDHPFLPKGVYYFVRLKTRQKNIPLHYLTKVFGIMHADSVRVPAS